MSSRDATAEYLGLSASAFERRVHRLDHEVAAIVDQVNGVLRAREGRSHEVEWEDDECESIPGRIVTHNHPHGDSFSPMDMRLAWEFGAAQLRAVTPDGTVYVLEAPDRGWGDYAWQEIAETGQTWAEAVFRDIEEGRLTTSMPMDVIWKEVAARLDLPYSRVDDGL